MLRRLFSLLIIPVLVMLPADLSAGSSTSILNNNASIQRAIERMDDRLTIFPQDFEASLLKGLLLFRAGNIRNALNELDDLTRRAPDFHLAHLVRGDILLARANTVSDIGKSPLASHIGNGQKKRLQSLRDEVRIRFYANASLDPNKIPTQLLQLDKSIKTALVVDKKYHRIYAYENSDSSLPPRLAHDFYVSTGKLDGRKNAKGDLRTPEGVYFITRYIPDSKLPSKYGIGAYPVNYPNELDRKLGRTGDGIWLHGTEKSFYSRPPNDSEGCVVLTNIELDVVAKSLEPGVTPVVITDEIKWTDTAGWLKQRHSILDALEQWRGDWQSNDVNRYLSNYSSKFWSQDHNLKSWSARKRRIARSKTFQRVNIKNVSMFAYPQSATNGKDIIVVNFVQDYRSNNFSSEMKKRIYFSKEKGKWRILYEGKG